MHQKVGHFRVASRSLDCHINEDLTAQGQSGKLSSLHRLGCGCFEHRRGAACKWQSSLLTQKSVLMTSILSISCSVLIPANDCKNIRNDDQAFLLCSGPRGNRHVFCASRKRFETCAQTPIRKRSAIHLKVMVVSARKRRAICTLPGSPFRRRASSSAVHPNSRRTSATIRSAFSSPLWWRSAP